jgi:hypothetical protein
MLQSISSPRREAASPVLPPQLQSQNAVTLTKCSYTQKAETLVAVKVAAIKLVAGLGEAGIHRSAQKSTPNRPLPTDIDS